MIQDKEPPSVKIAQVVLVLNWFNDRPDRLNVLPNTFRLVDIGGPSKIYRLVCKVGDHAAL